MQDVYDSEQAWMNDKDEKYTNLFFLIQSKLCLSWFPAKKTRNNKTQIKVKDRIELLNFSYTELKCKPTA